MLEQAHKLADKGFPIIPIRTDTKQPAMKMWPDEATTDRDTHSSRHGAGCKSEKCQTGRRIAGC